MVVRIRAKMAQRKKLAWPLRSSQPLLAVERLVANDGWVTSRVKAVSRRRRGPQARLYRACHPAILDHRGRRLTPATLLPPPSMRGFTPPVTPQAFQTPPRGRRPALQRIVDGGSRSAYLFPGFRRGASLASPYLPSSVAGEALPPPSDIGPGPRAEWDFNPPDASTVRHTVRRDPTSACASA